MATIFSNAFNNMNLGHKVMANEHRGKVQTVYWNFPSLPGEAFAVAGRVTGYLQILRD